MSKLTNRPESRYFVSMRKCEREILREALVRHKGHNSETARFLGLSRRTLYSKLRDHGLEGEASALRAEAGIMGPRKVDLDEAAFEGSYLH